MSSRSPLVLWLLAAAACTAPTNHPPPAHARPSGLAEPAPAADDCGALTRAQCMAAATCTLEGSPRPSREYRCRPARAPCELDLAQDALEAPDGAARRTCEARPGCRVVPGGCYCHCRGAGHATVPDGPEAPACQCECGGGPPPTCAPVEPAASATPDVPGPADEVLYGPAADGLALGLAVPAAGLTADAPIEVTLALKNTSSAPITVYSHVATHETHLDWFALELTCDGQEARRRTITLHDDRDKSAPVTNLLRPGEVLAQRVDLREWTARRINGGRPLGPGRHALSASYRVEPGHTAGGAAIWSGVLRTGPRPLEIAGTPVADACGADRAP